MPNLKWLAHGPRSGVDLVKKMIKKDELNTSFVMFDHIKRVHDWTTMGAHVYNLFFCCSLTIALCEMKVKDFKS
jgi:hypothetical protein